MAKQVTLRVAGVQTTQGSTAGIEGAREQLGCGCNKMDRGLHRADTRQGRIRRSLQEVPHNNHNNTIQDKGGGCTHGCRGDAQEATRREPKQPKQRLLGGSQSNQNRGY